MLHGPWTDTDRAAIEAAGATGLELNYAKGFEGSDLDFLEQLPKLERLKVIHWTLDDVGGVTRLPRLEALGLSTYAPRLLDFGTLPALRRLAVEWRSGAESLFACGGLTELTVNSFPDPDLHRLDGLRNLRVLRVFNDPKLVSCNGLELLTRLEVLGFARLPKLEDFDAIGSLSRLRELDLQTCRRLSHLEFLRALTRLERLSVLNCGEIASLEPLRGLHQLLAFFFYESTHVADGDLSVLLQLPVLREVAFANRRHYSHSSDDLKAELALRTLEA